MGIKYHKNFQLLQYNKHEFNMKPLKCLNFEQLDSYFEIIILRYAYGCVFS